MKPRARNKAQVKLRTLAKEIVEWWEAETGVLFDYAALQPGDKHREVVFEITDREPGLKAEWNERIRSALIRRDASFFREFADALEFSQMELLNVNGLAAQAFIDLRFSKGGLPTKREVRERTRDLWAIRKGLKERGNSKLREDIKGGLVIGSMLQKFPKQNWTRIFKKLGLENLPEDPGGQPRQRRNRLLSTQ
jgi:hypothetical protein